MAMVRTGTCGDTWCWVTGCKKKEFEVFQDYGLKKAGKLMLLDQTLCKSFLLFYKCKTFWEEEGPLEDELMC
jgi:hypothetical protein